MTNLDDYERLVLDRARRGLSPTDADQARVKAAAAAAIAGAASLGGSRLALGNGRSAIVKTTARVVRLFPTALAAVAVAAGAGGIGYRLGFDAGRKVPTAVVARTDLAIPTAPIQPEAVPARPVETPPRASDPAPAVHAIAAAGPSAPARGLGDELDTLKQVDRALREQRPRDALDLLDALDRYAPKGRLEEERAAARVLALCDLRPRADARTLAVEFSKRHPGSVYEPRVTKACAPSATGEAATPTEARERISPAPETHVVGKEDNP
jgi:hypothetical protein